MPKLAKTPRPVDSRPQANNAWGKLRSLLARNGYTQAWIKEQLGDTASGRKTHEVVDALITATNTTKAKEVREERIKANVISAHNRSRL